MKIHRSAGGASVGGNNEPSKEKIATFLKATIVRVVNGRNKPGSQPQLKESDIVATTRIQDDLDLDSIDLAEISMALEGQYRIYLEDGAITSDTIGETFDDVVDFFHRQLPK